MASCSRTSPRAASIEWVDLMSPSADQATDRARLDRISEVRKIYKEFDFDGGMCVPALIAASHLWF